MTHAEEIERNGYTIVTDVFDHERAAALIARLEELELALDIRPAGNRFEGTSTHRIYNLLAHGALFEAIPTEPTVLELVEGVLDDGCLVSSLSSIAIGTYRGLIGHIDKQTPAQRLLDDTAGGMLWDAT